MPDLVSLATTPAPLLTIAIPTYNRAVQLEQLLESLLPQLASCAVEIQLLVCDNASTDETASVTANAMSRSAAAGTPFELYRHEVNRGMDGNFLACWQHARGRYFWMCSDDDVIVPGALERILPHLRSAGDTLDILYVTSYGFRTDYIAERQEDKFKRSDHTMTDAHAFVTTLGMMFTFISGMIVNRERALVLMREDPSTLRGTFLLQLSWVLPLLANFRKGVVLWDRQVAARLGHANGYSLGKVFGGQFVELLRRLMPGRKDLADSMIHFALRRWFPSIVLDIRSSGNSSLRFEEAGRELRAAYGSDPRFWIFTWPVLWLPMPAARLWARAGAALSSLLYALRVPGFWKNET